MLGHRRKHDRVRAALSDQQRNLEGSQDVVAVDLTRGASYPYMLLIIRADVEIGRGDFDTARAHLEGASATLRKDRGLGLYDAYLAELALWERRWAGADEAVDDGLARARSSATAQIRVQLCAKGLRAQAELAALARARRDGGALRDRLGRARELFTIARRAAAEASVITPNAEAVMCSPEPSMNAPAMAPDRKRGRTRQRPGNGSNARRSPLTAAGARQKRSWPTARPGQ